MRLALEMRTSSFARVPLSLQRPQRADHAVRRVDRVGPGAHDADMGRTAAHLYLEPQHADIRARQLLILRFGDERRVGAIAA